jgi:hypothetical protein
VVEDGSGPEAPYLIHGDGEQPTMSLEKQIEICCLTPGRLALISSVTNAIPDSANSSSSSLLR